MIDQPAIQSNAERSAELAALMSAYEHLHGPVETLPIYCGERPKETFRIVSDKPKAKTMPSSSRALRKLDHNRVVMNSARKVKSLRRLETIREMAARGAKVTEMAEATGINAHSVMRLLRENKIERGPRMDLEG